MVDDTQGVSPPHTKVTTVSATIANPGLVKRDVPNAKGRDIRALLLVVAAIVGWALVVTVVLLGILLVRAAG